MGTIILIVIGAAIIGGLLGMFSGGEGEKGSSAATGAAVGAMGCAYLIFRLAIYGGLFLLAIWLFTKIFG